MSKHVSAVRRFLQVPLALIASVALIAAATPTPPSECEQAQTWVTQHLLSLPTTLPEFSKQPYAIRKQIYGHLALATRKALWREQLSAHVTDPQLNEAQRDLVREALAKLDTYLNPASGRAALLTDRFDARVKAAFDLPTARNLFASLGPPQQASVASARVSHASLLAGLDHGLVLLATAARLLPTRQIEDCSCASDSDWCGSNKRCTNSGGECNILTSGCGSLWQFPCDGLRHLAS